MALRSELVKINANSDILKQDRARGSQQLNICDVLEDFIVSVYTVTELHISVAQETSLYRPCCNAENTATWVQTSPLKLLPVFKRFKTCI